MKVCNLRKSVNIFASSCSQALACDSKSHISKYAKCASRTYSTITETPTSKFSAEYLRNKYVEQQELLRTKTLPKDVDSSEVFASNELDLNDINVYGFDYDYTIAQYHTNVENLIYELGREKLIGHLKYPPELHTLTYNRNFAIRGLHYDIEKGFLMKLDQFQQIQPRSIYKGLTPVDEKEMLKAYGSKALPLKYVEGHLHGETKMAHLADLFSMPEMCLLRQVAQYFMERNLPYHSVSLFNDVKTAIGSIHPEMHRLVGENVEKYLMKDENLVRYIHHLKAKNKQTFIITNSPFSFVHKGLSYLFGHDWQDLFDVVIAGAKKPAFFVDTMRPFRQLDQQVHKKGWHTVETLDKKEVYLEGNLASLHKIHEWKPQEVLYFGDHPYSDLADLTLHHLWRTGAIISELDHEIDCLNGKEYKKALGWLQMVQKLIETHQDTKDPAGQKVILEWIEERDQLRDFTKKMFNPYFGSVFRTFDNPTYFSRRLFRFADIYTSKLSNLSRYSSKHVFYPRKGVLPHEYKALFV